jgi:hypothetical protein
VFNPGLLFDIEISEKFCQIGSVSRYPSGGVAFREASQHSVHPTGGSLRVFRQFVWLGVDSVKMALSRPARQRVTQTVSLKT